MDIISETQNSKTQNFMNKVLDLELKWVGYRLKKFQEFTCRGYKVHVQFTWSTISAAAYLHVHVYIKRI